MGGNTSNQAQDDIMSQLGSVFGNIFGPQVANAPTMGPMGPPTGGFRPPNFMGINTVPVVPEQRVSNPTLTQQQMRRKNPTG
ncbi:MAG TPA: hypothetical protein VH500_16235 [Nitrososphaeraceae archaeon]|jgi:hypothetical protein